MIRRTLVDARNVRGLSRAGTGLVTAGVVVLAISLVRVSVAQREAAVDVLTPVGVGLGVCLVG